MEARDFRNALALAAITIAAATAFASSGFWSRNDSCPASPRAAAGMEWSKVVASCLSNSHEPRPALTCGQIGVIAAAGPDRALGAAAADSHAEWCAYSSDSSMPHALSRFTPTEEARTIAASVSWKDGLCEDKAFIIHVQGTALSLPLLGEELKGRIDEGSWMQASSESEASAVYGPLHSASAYSARCGHGRISTLLPR